MATFSRDIWESLEPLLTLLSGEEQNLLEATMKVEYYDKNETIYKNGDDVTCIYFLAYGSVKLSRESIDGFNSLQLAPLGRFFDISSYFTTQIYGATAETCSESKLYVFPISTLDYLLTNNISVSNYFLKMMASDLERMWQRQVQLKSKQMRGRLADTLLYIASLYDYEADGYTLGIQLSRNDLSALSGMTASNVSRVLSAFALDRVVSLEGRHIGIIDKAELQVIAEQE